MSMLAASSLDSASHRLVWSNIAYVGGAALTLLAALVVLLDKRAAAAGEKPRSFLLAEFVGVLAAIVSLGGTMGAIHYSDVVSHLKDVDLDSYKVSAGLKIEKAKTAAADANQKAQEAEEATQQIAQQNLQLQKDVKGNKTEAEKAESQLGKQNKETSDFAHAVAQQQGVMAEQAKVSPVLNDLQIQALASFLTPYRGQDVILHSTADTTVLRTKTTVAIALNKAGITFQANSMDMGALYQ